MYSDTRTCLVYFENIYKLWVGTIYILTELFK